MKVLFCAPSAFAHLNPLVPLAGALQGAGHEVRVATHPEMTGAVRAMGLTAVAAGEWDFPKANAHESDALYERVLELIGDEGRDRAPGRPPSKMVLRGFRRYYDPDPPGARGGLLADDLVAIASRWRPDLIVWDSISFPAALAARVSGAAHARVLWSVDDVAWLRAVLGGVTARPGAPADPMIEHMRPMLERFGVEFGEDLLLGQFTIDAYPGVRLRAPSPELRYVPLRPVPYNGTIAVPDWLDSPGERPRVAVSLGAGIRSFFPGGTSKVAAEALFEVTGGLDVEVVATLNEAQLASVERVPDHVRVVDYLPLNLLMPTCAAIIHHGGGGTFAAAVAHRVPQLVWKERSVYYDDIARLVEESGAGLIVDDEPFSVDVVRKQLLRITTDPSFAAGAAGLYRDALAVPAPTEVVPVLERLTEEHREVTR
jgi:UDP:flavonoid glycosyltransferase YjiC (YdhE family)